MNLFSADVAYYKQEDNYFYYLECIEQGYKKLLINLKINESCNGRNGKFSQTYIKKLTKRLNSIKYCFIFTHDDVNQHHQQPKNFKSFKPTSALFLDRNRDIIIGLGQCGSQGQGNPENLTIYPRKANDEIYEGGDDRDKADDNDFINEPSVLGDSEKKTKYKCDNNKNTGNNTRCDFYSSFNIFCQLHVDSILAGCISKSLIHSNKFLKGFLRYLTSFTPSQSSSDDNNDDNLLPVQTSSSLSTSSSLLLNIGEYIQIIKLNECARIPMCIIIHLTNSDATVNHSWCHRLTHLMRVQHALDDTLNWLSTLGGAYSSLGEQDLNFAYLAGKKSEQQLRLALFLDIPPLVMRCKLFWALSFAQKKKFKRAEVIIRDQYESAKKLLVPDPVLLNMCKGIWSRLKYHKLAARGRCNGRWKCGDVADGVVATRLTSSITTEPKTPDVATNSIAANRTTARLQHHQ